MDIRTNVFLRNGQTCFVRNGQSGFDVQTRGTNAGVGCLYRVQQTCNVYLPDYKSERCPRPGARRRTLLTIWNQSFDSTHHPPASGR